jgi:hypothetical protein
MSKGSGRRPTDEQAFGANFDAIFKKKEPDLESRDFYELMQAYRLEPWDAAAPFEAVKAWLRNPTYEWGEQ